jgi:hypothetical protein
MGTQFQHRIAWGGGVETVVETLGFVNGCTPSVDCIFCCQVLAKHRNGSVYCKWSPEDRGQRTEKILSRIEQRKINFLKLLLSFYSFLKLLLFQDSHIIKFSKLLIKSCTSGEISCTGLDFSQVDIHFILSFLWIGTHINIQIRHIFLALLITI